MLGEDGEPDPTSQPVQGYYAWGDSVTCSWNEAVDAESGIVGYEAALISRAGRPCIEDPNNRTAGKIVVRQRLGCNETKTTFAAPLGHASAFRCVVWAINGAGLRSSRVSADFVVDVSSIGGLSGLQPYLKRVALTSGTVEQRNDSYITGSIFTVAISADLGTTLAMHNFEKKQEVSGGRSSPAPSCCHYSSCPHQLTYPRCYPHCRRAAPLVHPLTHLSLLPSHRITRPRPILASFAFSTSPRCSVP
jgi:hypothetical protein